MRHSSTARTVRIVSRAALVVTLVGLTLAGVASAANFQTATDASGHLSQSVHVSVSFGQQVVNDALNYVGTPYCWGGGGTGGPTHGDGETSGPNGTGIVEDDDCAGTTVGFDCTGLALYAIYAAGGPNEFADAHSPNIVNYGTHVPVTSVAELQPSDVGDVLVFGSGAGLHVGIYAGIVNGQREMVDSNTSYYIRPNGVFEEPVAWEVASPSYQLTAVLQFSSVAPSPPLPVPTKTTAANHVLRVSATGTAYVVDASGVPHWIPDALTYACDVATFPLWNDVSQAQVDALGNGQPWATRCARPQDAANHILVVSATNTSYLADSSGVIHWIPSTTIYNCLADEGYPVMRNVTQTQVNVLGNGKPWATCTTAPPASDASAVTYTETVGSVAHAWSDYTDAGGAEGPTIARGQSVQISCRVQGWTAPDGNDWWYQIASDPWDDNYYVSADPFYNNGATSGSLHGTPFYDSAVPICG